MPERSHLSIGEVLSLLRDEFPDVTISKIRFLESQGLVDPERTPSGYRKFYDHDVERLRWILRQQREHFLPLKVIRGRLSEQGAEPGAPVPAEVATGGGPAAATNGSSAAMATHAAGPAGSGEPGEGSGHGHGHGSGSGAAGAASPAPAGGPGPAATPTAGPAEAPARRAPAAVPSLFAGLHSRDDQPATAAGVGVAPSGDASPPSAGAPTASTPTASTPTASTPTASTPTGSTPAAPGPVAASSGGAPREPAPVITGPAITGPAITGSGGPGRGSSTGPASRTPPGDASAAGPPAAAPPVAGPVAGPAHDEHGAAATRPAAGRDSGPDRRPGTATPGARTDRGRPEPAADEPDTYTADELACAVGAEASLVAELKQYGLIAPHAVVAGTAYYDDSALAVARAAADLGRHGVEVRHLRIWRNAADREADLFQQVVLPFLRQRNPQARRQAVDTLAELAAAGAELRAALVQRALREIR